ncbi:hypothetical protein D3C76_1514320 [compost metagenome]
MTACCRDRQPKSLGCLADAAGLGHLEKKLDLFERIHAILPLCGKLYPDLTGFFHPWEKLDSPQRHKNKKW